MPPLLPLSSCSRIPRSLLFLFLFVSLCSSLCSAFSFDYCPSGCCFAPLPDAAANGVSDSSLSVDATGSLWLHSFGLNVLPNLTDSSLSSILLWSGALGSSCLAVGYSPVLSARCSGCVYVSLIQHQSAPQLWRLVELSLSPSSSVSFGWLVHSEFTTDLHQPLKSPNYMNDGNETTILLGIAEDSSRRFATLSAFSNGVSQPLLDVSHLQPLLLTPVRGSSNQFILVGRSGTLLLVELPSINGSINTRLLPASTIRDEIGASLIAGNIPFFTARLQTPAIELILSTQTSSTESQRIMQYLFSLSLEKNSNSSSFVDVDSIALKMVVLPSKTRPVAMLPALNGCRLLDHSAQMAFLVSFNGTNSSTSGVVIAEPWLSPVSPRVGLLAINNPNVCGSDASSCNSNIISIPDPLPLSDPPTVVSPLDPFQNFEWVSFGSLLSPIRPPILNISACFVSKKPLISITSSSFSSTGSSRGSVSSSTSGNPYSSSSVPVSSASSSSPQSSTHSSLSAQSASSISSPSSSLSSQRGASGSSSSSSSINLPGFSSSSISSSTLNSASSSASSESSSDLSSLTSSSSSTGIFRSVPADSDTAAAAVVLTWISDYPLSAAAIFVCVFLIIFCLICMKIQKAVNRKKQPQQRAEEHDHLRDDCNGAPSHDEGELVGPQSIELTEHLGHYRYSQPAIAGDAEEHPSLEAPSQAAHPPPPPPPPPPRPRPQFRFAPVVPPRPLVYSNLFSSMHPRSPQLQMNSDPNSVPASDRSLPPSNNPAEYSAWLSTTFLTLPRQSDIFSPDEWKQSADASNNLQ